MKHLDQTTKARRRILIIEDDRETARQLLEFFGEHGYCADLALNGSDGLRLALSAPYAVMTIDWMLPGIDGLAVIRGLRDAGINTYAVPPNRQRNGRIQIRIRRHLIIADRAVSTTELLRALYPGRGRDGTTSKCARPRASSVA